MILNEKEKRDKNNLREEEGIVERWQFEIYYECLLL